MAQMGVQMDQQTSCLICQDLLKDVVTFPCEHSYCMACLTNFWNEEDQEGVHSCPQCRETSASRTDLVKSTTIADLVKQLRKTGLKKESLSVDEHKCHKTEVRPEEIQKRIQDREEDVKLLQQEVQRLNGFADKSVKESGRIFEELILLMKKRSFEVKQQLRSRQKTEVNRVKELQETLQQEMAELKQLTHTQDHTFHHKYSLIKSESLQTQTVSLRYFEDMTAAVFELGGKLQDILRDTWTNGSQMKIDHFPSVPQAEPKSRAELLQYSCKITLDPNTVNSLLLLSEEDRRATLMRDEQLYPGHPERFVHWRQVLSREALTGRHYWEVEWQHKRVSLAVVYKNIGREGTMSDCVFGFNDKSWALECNCSRNFKFRHNCVKTNILGPCTSRIGVYLDHSAGVVSFYSISETMTLLHRVQTTFTQPLYAGVWFSGYHRATAKFIQPE